MLVVIHHPYIPKRNQHEQIARPVENCQARKLIDRFLAPMFCFIMCICVLIAFACLMTFHRHSSNGGELLWQTNAPYLCAVYSNAHKVKTSSRPRLDYQLVLMWFFQKIMSFMHAILLKEYWSSWNKNAEGLHIRKIIEHSFMWQNIHCHYLDCVCRRQRAYPYSHISLTPLFAMCH